MTWQGQADELITSRDLNLWPLFLVPNYDVSAFRKKIFSLFFLAGTPTIAPQEKIDQLARAKVFHQIIVEIFLLHRKLNILDGEGPATFWTPSKIIPFNKVGRYL